MIFEVGQTIQYKDSSGYWFTGTVLEYDALAKCYIIDATVYEYRPNIITRSVEMIRPL